MLLLIEQSTVDKRHLQSQMLPLSTDSILSALCIYRVFYLHLEPLAPPHLMLSPMSSHYSLLLYIMLLITISPSSPRI